MIFLLILISFFTLVVLFAIRISEKIMVCSDNSNAIHKRKKMWEMTPEERIAYCTHGNALRDRNGNCYYCWYGPDGHVHPAYRDRTPTIFSILGEGRDVS